MSQVNHLISRETAIELFKNLYLDDDSTVECPDECNSMIDACIETLRELPDELRWTPISEGLPKEKINEITGDLEYVLCSMKYGSVVPYRFGSKISEEEGHFWGRYDGIMDEDVVAWMYLPEKYVQVKERSTEE